ncbi:MAG: hypothetical protein J7K26_00390 [Candidatus Aenigmarchaeota archaeon]|nr:hypothetical protein [Candidatus Aenigmarchaeota archaeon]
MIFDKSIAEKILIYLYEHKDKPIIYISLIYRALPNHAQGTIHINVMKLRKLGLITCRKKGRIKILNLTEKGLSIAKKLYKIEQEF